MFCPYLKKGLTIRNNGNMIPCCAFVGNLDLNAKNNSIEEYFNSLVLSNLNLDFENNVWPAGCIKCQENENNKQTSLRLNAIPQNDLFKKYYIDIEIGNECNSDCVTCNPESSTKILSRIKKYGTINEIKYDLDFLVEDSWHQDNRRWRDIENNIEDISCIKFLGGEPFLSKKVWGWLEKETIQNKKHDIVLQITTNASFLLEKKLKLLNDWKSLIINVSIDGVDKQFEWIRQGLNWETVEKNTKQLSFLTNSTVSIQFVASIYSITGAAALLKWTDDNNYLFYTITLTTPEFLRLKYAPIDVLEKVLEELKEIKLKRKQNKIQLLNLVNLIKKSLEENKHNPKLLKKMTDYFNQHRVDTMDSTTLKLVNNDRVEQV